MAAEPRVSGLDTLLVIVTYRSDAFADSIVGVVQDHLARDPGNRVVLVENSGSTVMAEVAVGLETGSEHRFRYLSGPNDGFAPAVNRAHDVGIRAWGAFACIALVNPDVEVDTTTMMRLREVLELDPTIGVCGPRLIGAPSAGGSSDRGCARRDWTPMNWFCELAGLGPVLDRWGGARAKSIDLAASGGLRRVDVTSGALLMIRAEVFGSGLDTRLPMYLEDQELCLRARRLGRQVVVDCSVTATHVGAASRKAAGPVVRRLQLMELATSPALNLVDVRGQALWVSRILVGLGGLTRCVLAGLRGAAGADGAWIRDQVSLGMGLMRWSVSPLDLAMPRGRSDA